MKRTLLWSLALTIAATAASAQGLTMGTMNGWTFTFSGNVNAFLTYTDAKCGGAASGSPECNFDGTAVPSGPYEKVVRIRTGLAPAFAIFEAKGKEGDVDLGVHFGFAPEIQTPYQYHDNCGGYGGCGAQLDIREVYLTAGGSWGQILAGRAVGLYQQQNLLTDMTVYGFGLSGGGGFFGNGNGTSLGHIGTGYTYPNFNAQFTYSTNASKPGVLSVGLFDPSVVYSNGESFPGTQTPRLEAEYVWTRHTGAQGSADKLMLYASGLLANVKHDSPIGVEKASITPWGLAAGVEWNGGGGWQLDGSGFYQSGVGTTLMFDDGLATDDAGNMRNSYGFLLQAQYMLKSAKWKFGASYGMNHLSETSFDTSPSSCDGPCDFVKDNSAIVASATYMWTKSLRWVFEYTYGSSAAWDDVKITSNQLAVGMMLFF